jgi:hypothetical protein
MTSPTTFIQAVANNNTVTVEYKIKPPALRVGGLILCSGTQIFHEISRFGVSIATGSSVGYLPVGFRRRVVRRPPTLGAAKIRSSS